jgi:signal transduction histidine kinase
MLALGLELQAKYPTDWSADTGMAQVLRDGTPMFVPEVTEAMVAAGARDPEHLRLLTALRFSAVIVVPLAARGLTLGALTVCMTSSGRTYDEADLALATDLAQRAGIAMDNARLYREAERARAEAESANRAKSQFLATMSHELRTPLNAIQGHVQLLEMELHGPVTDAQRDALARVERAQQHLLSLIDEVLGYARLESGRVEYDVRPVRVVDVVADVLPMVESQLAAKGIAFAIQLAEPAAERPTGVEATVVLADREKLAQVLINLLSNAAKFTPAGGRVTISVDGVTTRGGDVVQLRVTDTGIGIPADKLEAIFEPFVQVRGPYMPGAGGTGLGLAISRDLARGMGADLRAESVEGEGSSFVVTLRRAPA